MPYARAGEAMRLIHTANSTPEDFHDQEERDWVYNGLDCCVTLEVLNAIRPQLDDTTSATYAFSRALQGPALEMRLRGILVDQRRKKEVIDQFYDHIDRLETQLDEIVLDGVGLHTFNWRSNPDLHNLFYNHLQIPPIRRGGKATVNREALERMEAYLIAKPIVSHLIAMRDLFSKIKMLRTGIDPDGRYRTSYNIAGTSTGRFSSSFSEFGTGGNLQNVEELLRSIFISDPGYKFAKFDAKTYAIPPVFKERLQFHVDELLHAGNLKFIYRRKQKYWPMILKEFGALGLPEEMAFIAWAETQFDPTARSKAGAAGMWQLGPDTARNYNLRVDSQLDERLDPPKATRAASRYLANLLAEFGEDSFMLAMASYNRGESGVRRVLHQIASEPGGFKKERRDFWHLYRLKKLPEETREYVPKVLAAAIVSMNAQKYGLAGTKEEND